MDTKKAWKKTGFGILFVAACFVAMYILMEFHGEVLPVLLAAVLLLVSAFLFLYEIFSDKVKDWAPEEQLTGKEAVSSGNEGEFRLKITKHMKEMESTQKELIDVLKNQSMLLQSQMENMEQVIMTLSEKQVNQTKSVIKFNKENARQLAISERETLEYVMSELKQTIENNAGAVAMGSVETEAAAVPEEIAFAVEESVSEEPVPEEPEVPFVQAMEEIGEEELFEISDLPGDEEYVAPEMPVLEESVETEETVLEEIPVIEEIQIPEEIPMPEELPIEEVPETEEFEIPDMPADIDLSALFEDMAEGAIEEAAKEEPLAELPAIEDIPVPEDNAPAEEPVADPLAGLSGDPNAMMTPEDIAKLLASMGQ